MKIYLFSIDWVGYYTNDAFVIVANNKDECIKIAQASAADEGPEAWTNKKDITCVGNYTGKRKKAFMLSNSFNAG